MTKSATLEDKILDFLETTTHPMQPKEIAASIKEKAGSVRVCIRRLYQKAFITKDGPNYLIPTKGFEAELDKRLLLDGQKSSLPLIHDLHVVFKIENLKKFAKDPERVADLYHKIYYEQQDTPPVDKKLQKTFIHDNQNIPCPHEQSLRYIYDIFNPINPDSFYASWEPIKKNAKRLSGGFQETFNFKTWKLLIQLYGTGTIKIIFSNSEHAFDAQEFSKALQSIDAIFQARNNILFSDIQSLFHIEMCHFNSDVIGSVEMSGTSKLNCTVQNLDNWFMRTYEKILGDELYTRNEVCLVDGNYDEHSLNGFLALAQGGLQPTMVNFQMYHMSRENETIASAIKANSRNITQINRLLETSMNRQNNINQQMMDLMSQFIKEDCKEAHE